MSSIQKNAGSPGTANLPPAPRAPVAAPSLVRPDWTRPENRDPSRLWLDKNENTDPELSRIVQKVLSEIPAAALHSYPDAGALYAKLGRYAGVGPDGLMLAAGSDGVIRAVFEAYIGEGDAVVRTDPTFAMYGVYAAMYGANVRSVAYRASNRGPILPVEEFLTAMRASRPRLVCLPNPDSPTGTVLEPDELRAIVEQAEDLGSVILIDEAYHPFHAETVAGWTTKYPHLVVARSTGKAWGMAGLRIGYAICHPAMAQILHKVRPMYETSTMAVAVFERMLDHEAEMRASVQRLQEGKRAFLAAMEELGFATHAGHGNFLHVSFGARAEAIHGALADLVYYRKDFDDPCLKGFSRFSTTTRERFEPVIERIRQTVRTRRA
jgi:histidinol-phosphate aminotransferase